MARNDPFADLAPPNQKKNDPFADLAPPPRVGLPAKTLSPLKIGAPSFQQFADAGAELPAAPGISTGMKSPFVTQAKAPTSIEKVFARQLLDKGADPFGAKRLTPKQQAQVDRAKAASYMADRLGEFGVQGAGGYADALGSLAQGAGSIADVVLPGTPAEDAVRRARRFIQEDVVGEPETAFGTAGRVAGSLYGTYQAFTSPAKIAAGLSRTAEVGTALQRALAAAANPIGKAGLTAAGRINRAGQLASGAAITAPLNVAYGLSPENTASGLRELGRQAEGKEGVLASGARALGAIAEPFADSKAGRVGFELLSDFVPNALFTGIGGAVSKGSRALDYAEVRRLAQEGDLEGAKAAIKKLQASEQMSGVDDFSKATVVPVLPTIPKKPTQGRIDRVEFSNRIVRALEAGDDAEVERLLKRQDEVLGNMSGMALGAGVGGTEGETAEERLRNAALVAGVVGGSKGGKLRQAATKASEGVGTLVNSLRKGAKQAEEFGLTANVELASMKDKRFAGVEDLGEDALELQLGAVNGTVEPLVKAAGLRMGTDVVAKPSFGLWFGEKVNADVQPSVLLQFGKDVDRKKALAVVAAYSRIAKQKAMFFMEPDDNGTRLALSFIVRDADGTPIPSNLVLDLVREGRAGWNGAMLTDDASRTILALDEGIGVPQAQAEIDRIKAVLQSAGFLTETSGATRVNAAEVGERGYAALADGAGVERGAWARARSDAERFYGGVAVTAEKQIAARRIFNRPDAQTLALNLDPNELAAVRTAGRGGKPGRIYTGPNHRGASYYAQRAGYKGALEDGYTLTNGEFVNRYEAEAAMELMAERGDKLAERSVNAVQGRESDSNRTSVLRSEDIYKADKSNELNLRIGNVPSGVAPSLAGKTFDIGGALSEGVRALSNVPGGKAQLAKVGLGAVGYGLSQAEDERLQGHGNALMGLAAYSLVHGKVKQGAKAAGAAVAEELAKSPVGRKVLDEISLDIRVDPRVKETVDVAMREMAKYRAIGRELAAEAKKRGGVFDRTVSDLVEKEAVEADMLSPEDMKIAVALAQKVADNSLGLKKVEARLMSADTYAKRGTAYLPRRYAKYDAKDVNDVVVQHKGKTFRIGGEKIRNDLLTREERDALGEIREASYRIADYFGRGSKDIATAHLFEALAEIPGVIHPEYVSAVREAAIAADLSKVARTPTKAYRGSPTAGKDALRAADAAKARAKGLSEQFKRQGQEYVTLPDTPQLGVLRGAVVRKDAAAYLNDLPDFQSTNRMYNRLMHIWKSAHTVFNVPATHLTNMASNVFMGILGGLPIQEQVIAIPRALKDIQEYGPTTRFLTEAGVIERALPTYGEEPIKGLARDETVLRSMMKTTRPETREALEAQGLKGMSWMEEKARKVGGKIETAYSLGDTMFRVALFDKLTKQGMTNEDALKEIMRVFPGYDTRSPILQKLKHISPFVMYPAKYLPAALDLIAEHPWRWALASASWAAVDQASRRQTGAVREEDLPPNKRFGKLGYLKPGLIQAEALGLKSNEAGKRLMFDMARFTPFTALTGSTAPGTTISAINDNVPALFQPSGPLMDIVARLGYNVDPFSGKPFIKKSDDAMDKLKKFTVGTTEAGRFSPGLAASLLLPSSLAYHLPNIAKDLYYGNAEAAKMSGMGLVGGRPVAVKRGQQARTENYKLQQQIREVNTELQGDLRAARDMVVRRNLIKKAMEKRQRLVEEFRKSRQP
jgi:hypothetical protein